MQIAPFPTRLRIAPLALHAEATSPIHLGSFAEATVRGAFGYTLKRLVCVTRERDCEICILRQRCVYARAFEPARDGDLPIYRKLTNPPRPFTVACDGDRTLAPGERFRIGFNLFGDLIDDAAYLLYSFFEMGRAGLGGHRGTFEVMGVELRHPTGETQEVFPGNGRTLTPFAGWTASALLANGDEPAAPLTRIRLLLETPVRVRRNGVYLRHLPFGVLARHLLRRVAQLSALYSGERLDVDFAGLAARADSAATLTSNLRWVERRRFSTRQRQDTPLGGLVGEITYEGDLAPFLPFLRLGEWVHVGKGATFGGGRYRIEEVRA